MVQQPFQIQPFDPGDAAAVSSLACQVFDEHVAPSFGPEGVVGMHAYISADAIAIRATTHTTLVAVEAEALEAATGIEPAGRRPEEASIVGVIEVRDLDHISMLFVCTAHTGQGIATALLARAEAECRAGGRRAMTVNSSLNAQSFYQRHGFAASSVPQHVRGFEYVPMEKLLA